MVAQCKPCLAVVAAALVTGSILGGCSETLPLANLPSLSKIPEKLLTKEEQDKAMTQMIEKGQTMEAEAAKQIEKGK